MKYSRQVQQLLDKSTTEIETEYDVEIYEDGTVYDWLDDHTYKTIEEWALQLLEAEMPITLRSPMRSKSISFDYD